MNGQEMAIKIAKEDGADYVQRMPDWDDKEVWLIGFGDPESDDIECIGYPEYLVIDEDNWHVTEPDESIKYMRYLDDEYGDGDDDGFEADDPIAI